MWPGAARTDRLATIPVGAIQSHGAKIPVTYRTLLASNTATDGLARPLAHFMPRE